MAAPLPPLPPFGILAAARAKVDDVIMGESDPAILEDLRTATQALDRAIAALEGRELRFMREAYGPNAKSGE